MEGHLLHPLLWGVPVLLEKVALVVRCLVQVALDWNNLFVMLKGAVD